MAAAAVAGAAGLALLKAAGAFGVAVLLARLVVKPLFDLVARSHAEEVFTAMALFVALGAGWATGQIGLSLSLGAFLGGMIIAETPYRAVIQSEIKPFRGLLLGFFFISVGLSLDAGFLMREWPAVVAVAVALVLVKVRDQCGRQPDLPLVGARLDAARLPAGAGVGVRLRRAERAGGARHGGAGAILGARRGGRAEPGGHAAIGGGRALAGGTDADGDAAAARADSRWR